MSKVPRDPRELPELLAEQLSFMALSASAYDSGATGEHKRLALILRVLVHDTNNSVSLLKQMGKKEKLLFCDMSLPCEPRSHMSHSGLIRMGLGGAAGAAGAVLLPMFDKSPIPARAVPFAAWWDGIVFIDGEKRQFSRSDLVRFAANQDGGAHVDPGLDREYADLTRNNSLGWMDAIEGHSFPSRDQVPASIRHIAYELVTTLAPEMASRPPDPEDLGTIVCGATVVRGKAQTAAPTENGVKVGRNSLCPCGSQKKHKKCCLM